MKPILKQLTAALLLVSLAAGDTIRTLRPDGGGMRPADRTPFMTALGMTPLGIAGATRASPAGTRFVQLNSNGTETLLDAAGMTAAIGAASTAAVAAKQDTLVSGTNIKTVNGVNILGAGNFHASDTLIANSVVALDATGATDESADILTAVNAAVNGNYKKLAFLPGVYKHNTSLTSAQCEIKIVGAGGGSTGDWTAVEQQGATMFIPNNNSLPVWKFEFVRGVFMEDCEVRGNGAGTSVCGVLIDNPSTYFAGNGFYMTNVTIRRFTDGFKSMGGCNVYLSKCGIFNCNRNIYIPKVEILLAHSYTIDQCSLGGVTSGVGSGGGTGDGRILQVEDGSFVTLINCEMGNCTDMIYVGGSGVTSAIVNVINGNMETMSASVLNTMNGGNFNMTGCRIGTGNKTVLRAIGLTGEIIGISLENNQAQGNMTMLEHHGVSWAKLSGNGLGKLVTEYTDNTFTTVRGTSVCERLMVQTRLTSTQLVPSASTVVIVPNVVDKNTGSKFNATTGEFAPGKRGDFLITANIRLDNAVAGSVAKLHVFVAPNGTGAANRATIASVTMGGAGTSLIGSIPLMNIGAGDIITVRLETGGAMNIGTFDNFTTRINIAELGYWN